MKQRFLLFSAAMMFAVLTWAQQTVSGRVTDDQGEALPGAVIIEKGTSNGTTTDVDGNYSLSVSGSAVLVYSFVGFRTIEESVNSRTTINVTLETDVQALDEVIVIGFGERRKKDLTGSIVSVDAKTIEKTAFLSPQFALQGNTPGVRVLNTSGDPNAQPNIQVRGIGTWNGRSQPLYVIDGQIINEPDDFGNQDVIAGAGRQTPLNLWNLINPQDIESISVLKDASAAAIYGSRAANGVVLITTKSGQEGDPTIEFNASVGWSTVPHEDRMLGTQEWVELGREMYDNSLNPNVYLERSLYGREAANDVERLSNFSPQFDPQSPYYINENTAPTYDHQDELTRTALDQNYNIKVSGGTSKVDYYVSLGYKNQEHPHTGNETERYTAAINLNTQIKSWLKVGLNYKYANSSNRVQEGTFPGIVDHAPWQPLRSNDPNLSFRGFAKSINPPDSLWNPLRIYGQATNNNALAALEYQLREFRLDRNLVQGYVELKPIDGLSIRGSLNLDRTDQTRLSFDEFWGEVFQIAGQDPSTIAPDAPNSVASRGERRNIFFNSQADVTAQYQRTFGLHSASLLFGAQSTVREQKWVTASGSNIQIVKDRETTGYGNDLANNSSIIGFGEAAWLGFVARGSYNYDTKYYMDVSFRRDASSGFAEDYRWGNFYSVSGAWRLSREVFMENLSFIDDLKLRGGYGEAGNDEAAVGNFAFLSTVGGGGSVRFGSGNGDPLGSYYTASAVRQLPNEQLSWETVVTINLAVDAVLLDNRMNFTMDVWRRTTEGILQFVNLPPSVGTANPLLNLGELKNEGIDLTLGWNDRLGDFTYGAQINASFLRNEITKLARDQPFFVGDPFGGPTRRIEIGRSIGHIWGYIVEGIYQSQGEIDDRNAVLDDQTIQDVAFVAPGDLYFANVGGNPTEDEPFYSTTPDSLLNSFDQTEIGDILPNLTYGININLGWKGFDFVATFYGESGAEKLNTYRQSLESLGGIGQNKLNTSRNRWTESNTNTMFPRAVAGDPAGSNRASSTRWLESTNFFRLNNWQIGYSLPKSLLSQTNNAVKSARVFIGGQNNILITDWSGLDPVNDSYPLPRTFQVGLNAKF